MIFEDAANGRSKDEQVTFWEGMVHGIYCAQMQIRDDGDLDNLRRSAAVILSRKIQQRRYTALKGRLDAVND